MIEEYRERPPIGMMHPLGPCWPWRKDGTWQHRHDLLRGDVRVAAGQQRQPSAGILNSQPVTTTEKEGPR